MKNLEKVLYVFNLTDLSVSKKEIPEEKQDAEEIYVADEKEKKSEPFQFDRKNFEEFVTKKVDLGHDVLIITDPANKEDFAQLRQNEKIHFAEESNANMRFSYKIKNILTKTFPDINFDADAKGDHVITLASAKLINAYIQKEMQKRRKKLVFFDLRGIEEPENFYKKFCYTVYDLIKDQSLEVIIYAENDNQIAELNNVPGVNIKIAPLKFDVDIGGSLKKTMPRPFLDLDESIYENTVLYRNAESIKYFMRVLFIFDLREIQKKQIDCSVLCEKIKIAAGQGDIVYMITNQEKSKGKVDVVDLDSLTEVSGVTINGDALSFVIHSEHLQFDILGRDSKYRKEIYKSLSQKEIEEESKKLDSLNEKQRVRVLMKLPVKLTEEEKKQENILEMMQMDEKICRQKKDIKRPKDINSFNPYYFMQPRYEKISQPVILKKIPLHKYLFVVDSALVPELEIDTVIRYCQSVKKRGSEMAFLGTNQEVMKNIRGHKDFKEIDPIVEDVRFIEMTPLERMRRIAERCKIDDEKSFYIITTPGIAASLGTVYSHASSSWSAEKAIGYFKNYAKAVLNEEAQKREQANQPALIRYTKKSTNAFFSTISAIPTSINAYLLPTGASPAQLKDKDFYTSMTPREHVESIGSASASLAINIPINLEYLPSAFSKVWEIFDKVVNKKQKPESVEVAALFFGLAATITTTAIVWDSLEAAGIAFQIIFSIFSAIQTFSTRFGNAIKVLNRLFDDPTKAQGKMREILDRLKSNKNIDIEHIKISLFDDLGQRKDIETALTEFVAEVLKDLEQRGIKIPGPTVLEICATIFDNFVMLIGGIVFSPLWAAKSVEGIELLMPFLKNSEVWNNNLIKIPSGYILSVATMLFYALNIHDFRDSATRYFLQIYQEKSQLIRNSAKAGGMSAAMLASGAAVADIMHSALNLPFPCLHFFKDVLNGAMQKPIEGITFALTDMVNGRIVFDWLIKPIAESELETIDIHNASQLLRQHMTKPVPGVVNLMKTHSIFKPETIKLVNGYAPIPTGEQPDPVPSVLGGSKYGALNNEPTRGDIIQSREDEYEEPEQSDDTDNNTERYAYP